MSRTYRDQPNPIRYAHLQVPAEIYETGTNLKLGELKGREAAQVWYQLNDDYNHGKGGFRKREDYEYEFFAVSPRWDDFGNYKLYCGCPFCKGYENPARKQRTESKAKLKDVVGLVNAGYNAEDLEELDEL